MMRTLIFIGLMLAVLMSCDNDDSNAVNGNSRMVDYMPLEIGNYWVYDLYRIDTSGIATYWNRTDSVIITRDTFIRSNQYFVLEGTNFPFSSNDWRVVDMLRDSSGYLINEKGQIRFSIDNFNDILSSVVAKNNTDTLYILTYQMEEMIDQVSVPAGDFEVLNFKGTLVTPIPYSPSNEPRFLNTLFADGVGKVLQSYFTLSGNSMFEKRLVRYNIE